MPEGSGASNLPAPQPVFTCPGGSMAPLPRSQVQQWDLQALLMAVPSSCSLWRGHGGTMVAAACPAGTSTRQTQTPGKGCPGATADLCLCWPQWQSGWD